MKKIRNREHKKVIKYMRALNNTLAQDEYLGLNRFRVDMYSEDWFAFDDGSGGILHIIFKLSDKRTGNTAYFIADNWSYRREISEHANDFLIRCSSGIPGHFPSLHYVAYDVHTIIPYDGDKNREINIQDGVVKTYSWIKSVNFD